MYGSAAAGCAKCHHVCSPEIPVDVGPGHPDPDAPDDAAANHRPEFRENVINPAFVIPVRALDRTELDTTPRSTMRF
jgi:hypothetical protein